MDSQNHCPNCSAALAPDAPEALCPACLVATALAPGDRVEYFGNYELVEEIGSGGMGLVWKARQLSLNRLVALKMIRSGTLANDEEVRRFLIEAEAAGQLQHPGVVAIHEIGTFEGQNYFTMDFVAGRHLGAVVDGTPLDAARAARYTKLIAEAVHYAHGRGILHRDLKPQNVMIDERDHPRVTDFGLAKHVGRDSDLTLSGVAVGSPSYMSPEQARGHNDRVGVTADVYSIGAILYHMLTGRPPFQAASAVETMQQVVSAEPAAPSRVNPSVPRDLETICLCCLEKDPARRYPSARALAEDCALFLSHEPIRARPVGLFGRTLKWARRHPAVAALSVAVFVLLTALAVGAITAAVRIDRERDKAVLAAEQARDHFARSLFDQARALRNSDVPNRRDLAITSVQKAALLMNERRSSAAPSPETMVTRAELRSEVLAALLAPEASVVREISIGVLPSQNALDLNGRFAAGVWMDNVDYTRLMKNDFSGMRSGHAIYDLITGQTVMEIEAAMFSQCRPAFAPDGRTMAVATPFGGGIKDSLFGSFPKSEVVLYDLPSRTILRKLPWPNLSVLNIMEMGVTFSPDSSLLVSTPRGSSEITLWDLSKGTHQSFGKCGSSTGSFATFTPDSKHIIFPLDDRRLCVKPVAGGEPREIPIPLGPSGPAVVQRAGSLLSLPVIRQNTGTIAGAESARLVLDWQTGAHKAYLPLEHPMGRSAAAFGPDGRLAFSDGGEIKILDLETGKITIRIRSTMPGNYDSLSWDQDGRHLTGLMYDGRVTRWELLDDVPAQLVRVARQPSGMFAYSLDNRWFAVCQENKVHLVSRRDSRQTRELEVKGKTDSKLFVIDLAFRPDGREIAVLNSERVSIFEPESGRLLSTQDVTGKVTSMAFNAQGHILIAGTDDANPFVRDLTAERDVWRGKRPEQVNEYLAMRDHISLSANGTHLLHVPPLGSSWPTRLVEIGTGRSILQFEPGMMAQFSKSPVQTYAAFITVRTELTRGKSGKGAFRPASSRDIAVVVHETATGRLLHQFPNAVGSAFSADQRLLALGFPDGRVELRETATGTLLLTWHTSFPQIPILSFSPDMRELAAGNVLEPMVRLDLAKVRERLARLQLDW